MKAAIYTRVSSEEQAQGGTSLEVQRQRAEAYCQAQGWQCVETFTDAGVSGAKADRPALQRLLAAVERGGVEVIVVAKMDRLARSMRHLSPMLGRLDDQGVALVSIAESFDSLSPAGRLMRNMLGSMAEWERDVIRERTESGRLARLREGGWAGGDAPLGFRVERSGGRARLILDEAEAALVRRAVSLLLDRGLSTGQAAKVLNAEGYLPRKAPRWTAALLRNHLVRGTWGGVWTYAKPSKRTKTEAMTVAIPPMLEPDRHAALLAYLEATTITRARKVVHPLSGLLVGECGHTYTGVARRDRGRARYRCRYMKEAGRGWVCKAPTMLAAELEALVWREVVELLADPDRLVAAAEEHLGLLAGAAEVECDSLERAQAEVQRVERALGETFARALKVGLDQAAMKAATECLEADLVRAREHAAMVAAMRASTEAQAERMASVQALAEVARERLEEASSELMAQVLHLLQVQVRVTEATDDGHPLRVQVTGSVAHDLLLGGLAPTQPGELSFANRTSR